MRLDEFSHEFTHFHINRYASGRKNSPITFLRSSHVSVKYFLKHFDGSVELKLESALF